MIMRNRVQIGGIFAQAAFLLPDRPGKGRRVAPIKHKRFKAVQFKMLDKPFHAAFLRHGGALIDAAAIGNHDRHNISAILSPPPARCPIRAALFFKCAVT